MCLGDAAGGGVIDRAEDIDGHVVASSSPMCARRRVTASRLRGRNHTHGPES
jgi:hypothetical protein